MKVVFFRRQQRLLSIKTLPVGTKDLFTLLQPKIILFYLQTVSLDRNNLLFIYQAVTSWMFLIYLACFFQTLFTLKSSS